MNIRREQIPPCNLNGTNAHRVYRKARFTKRRDLDRRPAFTIMAENDKFAEGHVKIPLSERLEEIKAEREAKKAKKALPGYDPHKGNVKYRPYVNTAALYKDAYGEQTREAARRAGRL